MAVSGKTSDFGIPYLEESDLPDMGAGDKAIAERVNAILKSIKGDATLATDGTLTLANVARFFSTAELTRTSTSFGSFSTPVRVELPRVGANQLVRIIFVSYLAPATGPPSLQLLVGGSSVGASPEGSTTNNVEVDMLASGLNFGGVPEGVAKSMMGLFASGGAALPSSAGPNGMNYLTKSAEQKPLTIEVVGKAASGTAKLYGAYLMAQVLG